MVSCFPLLVPFFTAFSEEKVEKQGREKGFVLDTNLLGHFYTVSCFTKHLKLTFTRKLKFTFTRTHTAEVSKNVQLVYWNMASSVALV